jgi:hypothetical protein
MRTDRFVVDLAEIRLDSVFNPYADRCALSDRREAPAIRRANLTEFLRAAKGTVTSIWFGRDLGYRGGRRTGLALTDEQHLDAFSARYGGISVTQATKGPPIGERTASVVWSILRRLTDPPFLWNVFPFHPHEPDNPMSNRCHTAIERRKCAPLVGALLDWLQPATIVAIGNDAHKALSNLGYECNYVRHPSYGGQADFLRGITELYGLPRDAPRLGTADLTVSPAVSLGSP